MNAIRNVVFGLAGLLVTFSPVRADESRWSFGVEADLLPYLNDGYSISAVAGRGRVRTRLVRAELTKPEFATDDGFRDDELEVFALVVDLFLRDDRTGWWFGAGVELWDGEVTEEASNLTRSYETTLLTAGTGYVWRLGRHFSINPWAGVHTAVAGDRRLRFATQDLALGTTAEASVKIGISF